MSGLLERLRERLSPRNQDRVSATEWTVIRATDAWVSLRSATGDARTIRRTMNVRPGDKVLLRGTELWQLLGEGEIVVRVR